MKTLSYTQEYYLCAINNKGNIPAFKSNEVSACLLVGGILELLEHQYIVSLEKDKLGEGNNWDGKLAYLQSLYDKIVSLKKPKSTKAIAESYIIGMDSKNINTLVADIGKSMLAEGCTEELMNQGLMKNKTKYRPVAKATTAVIEKIRAEFLEEGEITQETTCLTALLLKSNLIKNYFSKVEADVLKKRIKVIRESEAYLKIKEVLDYIDVIIGVIIAISSASSIASSSN